MDPNSAEASAARARLVTERDRLEELLQTVEKSHEEDGPIDMLSGDAGADTSEAAATYGVRDDLRREIRDVDEALARVDSGTYGIDEVTGEPIDPARLEAEPTARTNVGI